MAQSNHKIGYDIPLPNKGRKAALGNNEAQNGRQLRGEDRRGGGRKSRGNRKAGDGGAKKRFGRDAGVGLE